MPIGSRGPGGYPDWQRVDNTVSPVLASKANSHWTVPQTIGPLNVSRYAGFGGRLIAGGAESGSEFVSVTFTWYDGPGRVNNLGETHFVMTEFITPLAMTFAVPNQGPWVTLTVAPIGAEPKYTFGWVLHGTNTDLTLPNPVIQAVLSTHEGELNAGVGGAWNPGYYFAGPVAVSLRASKEKFRLSLRAINYLTGASVVTISHQVTEPGVYEEFTWPVPLGSWEAFIVNESAEKGTYAFQMTPSATGA